MLKNIVEGNNDKWAEFIMKMAVKGVTPTEIIG